MVDEKKGRPTKSAGSKRDIVLSTKVSALEHSIIQKKLDKLKIGMAEYVREAGMNLSLTIAKDAEISRKIDKITVSQMLHLAVVHTRVMPRVSLTEMEVIKDLATEIHKLNCNCASLLQLRDVEKIDPDKIGKLLSTLDTLQEQIFKTLQYDRNH